MVGNAMPQVPRHILLRKLLRELKTRWGSLLTLVAIMAIGVGCFVGLSSIYYDMDAARARHYAARRLADFTLDFKRAPESIVREVASHPNVRMAQGRVHTIARVDMPDAPVPILGSALSMPETRRPVLNDILLRTGTYFTGTRDAEVILDHAFARAHQLRPGDSIRVLLPDKQHDLLIVGTAVSPEYVFVLPPAGGFAPDPARFAVLYLPERFLQEASNLDGAFNQIIGFAHDTSESALDRTLRTIAERQDAYGVLNYTPVQDQPSVSFLHDELAGVKAGAAIVPGLFLGVAALILHVLLGRIVQQQRMVIGVLKAIGYERGEIIRHYLGFGLIIGGVSAILGVAFGLWIQETMIELYREIFALPDVRAHLQFDRIAIGVAISLLAGSLGTLRAVWQAANLDPAIAMRPPPPEQAGRVPPERIVFLWSRLSFTWKIVLRSIFRNPLRSGVTTVASAVSLGLMIATLALNSSMTYMMDFEMNRMARQDVTVNLRDPIGDGLVGELDRMAGVGYVEPQLIVACDLQHGPYRKRAGIIALPEDHRLFTPLDARQRPVRVPESGLLLSTKLAEVLNVRPGDTVTMRPLIGRRETVAAPVAAVVDAYMGMPAYARIDTLSHLLGEAWTANTLLVKTRTDGATPPYLEALKERPSVVGVGERRRAFDNMEASFGDTMRTMLVIQILFAGLLAFGSVLNNALVSLSERQREVGTLRVLGFHPPAIAQLFSRETYLLGVLGCVPGIGLGIGLVHLLAIAYDSEMFRMPVRVTSTSIGTALVLMAAFLLISQWAVRRLVKQLNWLDVMKAHE